MAKRTLPHNSYRTSAKRLLGDTDPVGQHLEITGLGSFTVEAVIPDPPSASHIQFAFLLSSTTLIATHHSLIDDWNALNESYCYFLLDEGTDLNQMQSILDAMSKEHFVSEDQQIGFRLQKFNSIAPAQGWMNNEMSGIPQSASTYFLLGITMLIVISAGFNYTNLSIARAFTRLREVGLRMVSGASRKQIFTQFVTEAVLISLIALIFSLSLLGPLQSAFVNLVGAGRGVDFATDYRVYFAFIVFAVIVGITAGFVPATLLSNFRPAETLKSISGLKFLKKVGLRNGLVIFQFVLSIVFLITARVITTQFQYAMNKDLGFQRSGIVNVELQGEDYRRFAQVISQNKDVSSISASSTLPATNQGAMTSMTNPATKNKAEVFFIAADPEFVPNLKFKLLAGKNFPETMLDNEEQFILVNETLVRQMGYGTIQDAVGQEIETENSRAHILGVLKDFHYRPVDAYAPIGPCAIRYLPSQFHYANVRIAGDNFESALISVKKSWQKLNNGKAFTYASYEDMVRNALGRYRIMSTLLTFISWLAMIIACLGMLGMAMYTLLNRQKEIAVRKVVGATSSQVATTLSRGFLIQMTTASLIAIPLGYFANHLWLERLPYKLDISPGLLLMSVGIVMGAGLLTVLSQSFKFSKANPVNFLRKE
ncbi:MAG: FtsX-like permease family protein [Bacteroidetes bacterium]|nr:FtsX-like permease family protein [Bacteroidota bacterium]